MGSGNSFPCNRISPACAGNTVADGGRQWRTTDQPRVRGEHVPVHLYSAPPAGSAPRARGTHDVVDFTVSINRISPACAGNTRLQSPRQGPRPDQPRVRGEHMAIAPISTANVGSAPRARGTPPTDGSHRRSRRISPACAGNTRTSPGSCAPRTDQPRVRGEHIEGYVSQGAMIGSAPRARGTPRLARRAARRIRISPACAGNTSHPTA